MSTRWQRCIGLSVLLVCLAGREGWADPLTGLSSDDQAVIQLLLEHQPSDAPRPLPSGRTLTITRTETNPRVCRWFTISGAGAGGSAVGCREGPRQWSLSTAAGTPVAAAPVVPAPTVAPAPPPAPVPAPAAPIPAAPPPVVPTPTVTVAPAPVAVAAVPVAAVPPPVSGPLTGGPLPTVVRPQVAGVPTTPQPGATAAGPPLALSPQSPPNIVSVAGTQPQVVAGPTPLGQVAALPPPATAAPVDVSAIPMPPVPPQRQSDIRVEAPPMEPPRPSRRPVEPAAAGSGAIVPPPLPTRRPDPDAPSAVAAAPAAVQVAALTPATVGDGVDEAPVRLVPAPAVPRPTRHPRDAAAAWRDTVTRLDQVPAVPRPARSPRAAAPAPTALTFIETPPGGATVVAAGGDVVEISALSFADEDEPGAQGSAAGEGPEDVAEFLDPRPDVPLPDRHPGVAAASGGERLDPAPDIPLPPRRPSTAG
ncbi:MAG: hypothetical protein H6842_04770 [Rhodospirillaceae bacterium]|nr:hypothetical protein [Rhodospirillaceae bacterium]